jgi:CHAD domain-containing protein
VSDPTPIRPPAEGAASPPQRISPAHATVENRLRAEQELTVAHDYDTVDRDLERLGMTVSRLPMEAGVVWRLRLPRGDGLEEWEPGNAGLVPPDNIARLLEGVVGRKPLVPSPPLTTDPGALRLREMIEVQRHALLAHEPGARLGQDPENLHEHRVAARRTRAFLRGAGPFLDPAWRSSLSDGLRRLGEVTGPVRDLDVLLEHLTDELATLGEDDRAGSAALIGRLEHQRNDARRRLVEGLSSESHRLLLARLRFPPRLAPGVETVPLDRITRKEFRRVAKTSARLGTRPNDSALHGLRIALKRARYAAELSAPRSKAGRRFIARARTLQTLLGEHHDALVTEQHLRSSTVIDTETAAAFVAGRIAERQVGRRTRLREQLPAAWKQLRRAGAHLD